jgi:hypothetical protein
MIYDVRNNGNDPITKIVYRDEAFIEVCSNNDKQLEITDPDEESILVPIDELSNFIKALEKAREVWGKPITRQRVEPAFDRRAV